MYLLIYLPFLLTNTELKVTDFTEVLYQSKLWIYPVITIWEKWKSPDFIKYTVIYQHILTLVFCEIFC